MGRLMLLLGWVFALIGCVGSVIGCVWSVSALISGWRTVTNEMLLMPLFWVYAFVMNGALSVVFGRATGPGEKGYPR
jgi:hypothetical protein